MKGDQDRPRADGGMTSLTIIVPMLNEAAALPELLAHLAPFRQRGCEVILVDGGSEDGSAGLAERLGFRTLASPPGRAAQMNAGAAAANGDVLLFLHADTRLPPDADRIIRDALESSTFGWGRFDVRIEGTSLGLGLVAWFMNRRSRLTGIATGDQALFVERTLFEKVGGFPRQPLMEDIEISKRLRAITPPACVRARVVTSGRRWDSRGLVRTIFLMWRLRFAYWRGAPPETLAREYRDA